MTLVFKTKKNTKTKTEFGLEKVCERADSIAVFFGGQKSPWYTGKCFTDR